MDKHCTPTLSIILVTPDRYDVIQRTVQSLQTQTIKDQLEIIIVAPSATALHLDKGDLQAFGQFHIVEIGEALSAGLSRVAGMRRASAPIVAYLEDHAFPSEPTWAEALLKAHQSPWAAVAPTLDNGNPESLISWASYLLCFGIWAKPSATYQDLPWRNCSYKRPILMNYGDELADMFIAEYFLHRDLICKGYQLYLDPQARLNHLNFTHLVPMLQEQFWVGQILGAARSQKWPLLRRLLYIAGMPLIPLVRLWRLAPGWQLMLQKHSLMPQIIPPLVIGLLAGSVGEFIGYLRGFNPSLARELIKVEVNLDRQACP